MVNVDLFYKPLQILEHLSGEHKMEMSYMQSAFVCGLIRQYKPKKIVEIGVASGGMTAVILNCIEILQLNTEVFSIDLAIDFYRDNTKKTGYLAEEYKSIVKKDTKHILFSGKYAVECLETIGKDIDFLILDTVHSLPGELLDFLACYPYLKNGAVVVLHDIALNHHKAGMEGIATEVLFQVAATKKILNFEDGGYPNIGAFEKDNFLREYIEKIFSTLTMKWNYLPAQEELCLYKNFYRKYYSEEELQWFEIAVRLNAKEFLIQDRCREWEKLRGVFCLVQNIYSRVVYIYGNGNFGKQFYQLFSRIEGMKLGGFIISDAETKCKSNMGKVYYLSEVHLDPDKDVIFVGVNKLLQEEICSILDKKGIKEYVVPNREILSYLI